MGECLIARGQTATKNVLDDIPVSGDYCSIVVLLQDTAGGPCENTKINCKDGTRWYNYTTNEAGMVLFKCNSGAANISANNWINGIYTFDQAAVSKNYDAPVGTKKLEKVSFNKINHFSKINAGWFNGQFRGIDRIQNLLMIGGGGGGGGSSGNTSMSQVSGGGGGGGGAKNFLSLIGVAKDELYNLYVGEGGQGVTNDIKAGSGGTTIGFGLSANGGGGGGSFGGAGGAGGKGLFEGGNGGAGMPNRPFGIDNKKGNDGSNGINGAGGGGGGGGYSRTGGNTVQSAYYSSNGGSVGGGKGSATFMNYGETVATNFGGGGGGSGMDTYYVSQGYGGGYFSGKGGDGYCGKIEFDM